MEEKMERNEVKIATRDIRIYLGECCLLFQRFDQIILSAGDTFVEEMLYITNILKAVGVVIDKDYLNHMGKPQFKTEFSDVKHSKTGRRETKKFHKLGLTKIPDLYMYTEPDKAIDIGPLKDGR